MDNSTTGIPGRIKVGGIKLSPQLIQFTCSYPPGRREAFNSVLGNLAERRINILFLTHETDGETTSITLCVEKGNRVPVQKYFQTLLSGGNQLISKESVGVLTVFPHRSSVSFLSEVLNTLHTNNVPLHGMCTSISALSVITDYSELDTAVAHLLKIVELPDNHAPFRQEFCIRQLGH